jgi:hypothetical protein
MSARSGPTSALALALTAATKTVTFQLEVGTPGAKSPFNFNGYTNGEATLSGGVHEGPGAGSAPGGKDVMRFTAPEGGSYRIFCGVPGHALSGMWIRFRVDPAAKAPSWVTGK